MKIYAEEYNWQNDIKLVEVRLFAIAGNWYEDYEAHDGLFFNELYTSYRAASMALLEQGYHIEFAHWEHRVYGHQEIDFVKHDADCVHVVRIEEMEVVK